MNIINEYTIFPINNIPVIIIIFALNVFWIWCFFALTSAFRDDKDFRGIASFILIFLDAFVIIVFTCVLFRLLTDNEHVVEAILDDTYPAKKLFEQYTIRSVNGQIYTLVEKIK